MDSKHLRAFLKIAELGSISRAAEALRLAQPSLSQLLCRLEDEVGMKLFRRTARGVVITEGGRIFEEHARHILRTMDQALQDMRELKSEVSGQVSFAMPVSVSRVLGVTLVEAVLKHAPRVSLRLIEIFSGYIRSGLEDGSIDLGILYDVGPLRHLSVKRLAREELYLIGPADAFAPSEQTQIPLRKLPDYALILPSAQHGLRQFLDREADRLGIGLNVRAEVDSLAHVGNLVERGHGYSIQSLPAFRDELQAGRLSAARIENGAIRRTLCLVRRSNSPVTRASIRVEDLTVKIMQQLIIKGRWRAEPEPTLG